MTRSAQLVGRVCAVLLVITSPAYGKRDFEQPSELNGQVGPKMFWNTIGAHGSLPTLKQVVVIAAYLFSVPCTPRLVPHKFPSCPAPPLH